MIKVIRELIAKFAMKKGIVLPFLLLLASVAFILGAFFVLDNKPKVTNQNSTQTASPTPTDVTTNWKTYTNNVEKFSVQYPHDWTYKEGFANVQFFPPGEINNDKSINLSVSDAPPPPCYSESTTLRIVKRGNKEVLVQKGSCYLGGKYTTDEFFQNKYVRLVFGESLDNKYDPIFDQILSTFKFLDQPEEAKFCGGIAGIACPTDYKCSLDGNYPDAGGKCVKE